MKKLAIAGMLSCFVVLVPAALAQQGTAFQSHDASAAPLAKTPGRFVKLSGLIAADRKSFLCDSDNRTLAIANPDVLRGIEGQHAKVRARLDSTTGELFIASAKPSRDERHPPRLDDAAFRK